MKSHWRASKKENIWVFVSVKEKIGVFMNSLQKHAKISKRKGEEKSNWILCEDSRKRKEARNKNFGLKITRIKSRSGENKFNINIFSIADIGNVENDAKFIPPL